MVKADRCSLWPRYHPAGGDVDCGAYIVTTSADAPDGTLLACSFIVGPCRGAGYLLTITWRISEQENGPGQRVVTWYADVKAVEGDAIAGPTRWNHPDADHADPGRAPRAMPVRFSPDRGRGGPPPPNKDIGSEHQNSDRAKHCLPAVI
jgi:hypothetical protein